MKKLTIVISVAIAHGLACLLLKGLSFFIFILFMDSPSSAENYHRVIDSLLTVLLTPYRQLIAVFPSESITGLVSNSLVSLNSIIWSVLIVYVFSKFRKQSA